MSHVSRTPHIHRDLKRLLVTILLYFRFRLLEILDFKMYSDYLMIQWEKQKMWSDLLLFETIIVISSQCIKLKINATLVLCEMLCWFVCLILIKITSGKKESVLVGIFLTVVVIVVFRSQCYQAGFLYCRQPSFLFCLITQKA